MKVITWNDEKAKKELSKRLDAAVNARRKYEGEWAYNERIAYQTRYGMEDGGGSLSADGQFTLDRGMSAEPDEPTLAINMVMKDVRFIHSQLSANPPSAVPRPTSSDADDRRKADAADRLIRYGLRQYKFQEMQDRVNLQALILGSAFGKTVFNPDKGDIVDFDEKSGEVTLEGDFDYTIPNTWDIYPDPDATSWEEVRFVFEKIALDYDEALAMFPDKERELKSAKKRSDSQSGGSNRSKFRNDFTEDIIEVFQYWEKGHPLNGMQGRFCWHLEDGTLLSELTENPHSFHKILGKDKETGEVEKSPIPVAKLPYHIITDIDIPNTYWGASIISFSAESQEVLNELFNSAVNSIRATGTNKLILPEGAEVAEDSLSDSPWDIVKITGSMPPFHMQGANVAQSTTDFIDRLSRSIMDANGTNNAVYGEMQRETSGFAMQYATQQSNMLRRRLFNKLVNYVEDVYKSYLSIIRESWDLPKTVHVLGKEKAFEAADIKGADIEGGFDLVVEYGTSLSLDPMARRDEIMMMIPVFEKAGVPARKILSMLKLNELEGMYDLIQLAEDRQREIIEEMVATGEYVPPELLEDHVNMLTYLDWYVMTAEYKYLEDEHKDLVDKHYIERGKLQAQKQQIVNAGAAQMAPQPGGPMGAPQPGQLPVPGLPQMTP